VSTGSNTEQHADTRQRASSAVLWMHVDVKDAGVCWLQLSCTLHVVVAPAGYLTAINMLQLHETPIVQPLTWQSFQQV